MTFQQGRIDQLSLQALLKPGTVDMVKFHAKNL